MTGQNTMHNIYSLCVCVVSCSVMSDSLRPNGLQPAKLFCPWDFPSKNTGVGCLVLFQGIFLTQGSNPCLLQWPADSLPLSHLGSPGPHLKLPQSFCGVGRVLILHTSPAGGKSSTQVSLKEILMYFWREWKMVQPLCKTE